MKAIHATWKAGQIVPAQPVDWPDGTRLSVEPLEASPEGEPAEGMLGDDPASIARWIAAYETLPPLRMTEAEEAEWQAARRDVKERTIAEMSRRAIEDLP